MVYSWLLAFQDTISLEEFMKTVRFVIIGVFVLGILALSSRERAAASTPITVGYLDFTWSGSLGNDEVTAEKPESKLWWNDGFWWASMWSSSGNSFHIFKLDWNTQNWTDTGVALDDRKESRADVLWDGSKLYVVSHIWSGDGSAASAGQRGELYRYSYSGGTYSLDFSPVEVTGGNSEALVIDKDSTGMLWVTYVQDSKVYVNHSTAGNDAAWGTPYVLPAGGADNVSSDDLSSLVAYDGHIGIMWSNQNSGGMYFAVHADSDTNDQNWTSVAAYTISEDDHINLKSLSSDGAGKVFAAVKTSQSAALLLLMVCDSGNCTSAGDWSAYTVYTGATGSPTRPAMLLDTSNRDIYYFARVNDDIYYKRSDMDNISFVSGWGDPFISSSSYSGINDPTTTKQSVNSSTDLVVMASDSSANAYFHNCIRLSGGTSTQCISANPTPEVRFSSATYEISEDGAPTAAVTVELTGSVVGAVTVNYAVTDGTAKNGLDYTASSGTLTFPSGSTAPQTIYVPILEDSEQEPSETVNLTLSGLTGTGVNLGAQNTATLTILDDDAPPVINFSSATYNVIENAGQATINVTISNGSETPVTVQYATANGTAVAGSDYVAIPPTTLTFNPGGPLTKSFNVTILNNATGEVDETVLLSLSNPSANAFLGTQSSSTLTIIDDDVPLEVAFESATYDVIENLGPATINVVLSRPFITPVTVYYQTSAGGTATPGSDYTAIPATQLTFAPGETSKPVTVTINDNDVEEFPETVLLNLSNPSANVTLGAQSTTTLTIFDNDIAPEIKFGSPTYSVDENGSAALIDVKLSHAFATDVSVTYQTANGTAVAGSDYTAIPPTTMTITAGNTSGSFNVLINNDDVTEPAETIQLILSNPSANATLGTPNTATLTILDDDTVPTITFGAAAYEVDENGGELSVTVNLDVQAGQTVRVDYATSDGTAEAGKDYDSASGFLAFPAGTTSKVFKLTIPDDTLEEGNETFNIALSNPENAVLGMPNSATITIIDDDLPPTVSFSKASYSVTESQGQILITALLSRPVSNPIVVDYATSSGTATAGDDYESAAGQLTFQPYQTSKSFTVHINDDSKNEQDETVYLSLNDANMMLSSLAVNSILTIIDDDRPDVQFAGSSYYNYGASTAMVEVKLSAPAEATALVNYATSDGTASAGIDYKTTNGTLIFQPGTIRQTFSIPILNATPGETGITINLSLSSPQMAELGAPDTAVLTLLDQRTIFLPLVISEG